MLYLLNRLFTEQRLVMLTVSVPILALPVDEPIESPVNYQNSALDAPAASILFEKLEDYITSTRAYENPELTLAQLAQALHVSANQLSQTINQGGQQNLYQLINHHRVTAACRLLVDPKQQHLCMSGIGYEVGFQSKNTFYAAFRRDYGITPSVYRKRAERAQS